MVSFSNHIVKPNEIIDTLPVGYRPNAFGVSSVPNGFDNQNGEFRIEQNGDVRYASDVGPCNYGNANIVFPMGG